MPYSLELARRIRDRFAALKTPEVEEKSMMGGLVFMVDGKMCVCVVGESMMCRLDPADIPAALTLPGCSPMAFTGRVMKGFVVVDSEGMATRAEFESWISQALEFNPRATSAKKGPRKPSIRGFGADPPRGTRPRPSALLTLALASLGLWAPAFGSDGTRLVKRAEALEKSSEIVVARRTGFVDSLVEKQREGHRCTFHFETWVVDSVLAGKASWTLGDTVRVFDAEQAKECWRDHESSTKGIEVGWISLKYNSPTMLTDQDSSSSRGILIGHLRRRQDLELYCHGSIERPDQADGIRDFARDSVRSRR
jgi:TfoX/Sxy family transcriptional regulator of competence genes